MSSEDNIIPPKDLIEHDGDVITFKTLHRSHEPGGSVRVLASSEPFEQSNADGQLRQVEDVEEACAVGQRIATRMKRIFRTT